MKRAKDIKINIDAAEVIGYIQKNNPDGGSDDEVILNESDSTTHSLRGANLIDKNGQLRRPETKKRKMMNENEVLSRIGEQQLLSANIMAKAIGEMAEKLSNPNNGCMRAQVEGLESKLDIRTNEITTRVAGVESKLDLILEKLSGATNDKK